MSDHVHERDAHWSWGEDGCVIMCWSCGETMTKDELNRRLNATERLSAVYAERIADYLGPFASDTLKSYAAALEEE